MIEANWLIFVAALVIGIVVAFWIFAHGSKKPGERTHRPDVLDEGAAPAQRNQALIDSASPASQYDLPVPGVDDADTREKQPAHIDPPAAAGTMAGIGEVIAVAAQEEADEARSHKAEDEAAKAPEPTPAAEAPKAEDTPAAAPEPVEPAPPSEEPAPVPAPATTGQSDDLRKIKGLGPKMQKLLVSLGVTTYAQIAAWSEADLDELDGKLGAFAGRPRRDKWVEQARFLAEGNTASYEAEFGKL
ncbi:hypothetical protein [Novosphingobium decolorationis]|uniref:Flap endonuclease-1-like 5' DNA nuclease n=1 Tax=Novosphingobium decolorationis TaxID=2698673 RepID=A0ABX8EAZ1_9SPHN|nr:hypothetical protein [Novosphingobium decolorationis]QVM86319.1 hypothetical protein HT578_18300 [Novosphingobium decolorationis]